MIELVLLLSGATARLLLAGLSLASAAAAGLFLAVLCVGGGGGGDDAERDASRRCHDP